MFCCHKLPCFSTICKFIIFGYYTQTCSVHTVGSRDVAAAVSILQMRCLNASPGSLSSAGISVKAFSSQRGKGKRADSADVIADACYLPQAH